jgi:hypothetical protein
MIISIGRKKNLYLFFFSVLVNKKKKGYPSRTALLHSNVASNVLYIIKVFTGL